jgi:hypothetical protein
MLVMLPFTRLFGETCDWKGQENDY